MPTKELFGADSYVKYVTFPARIYVFCRKWHIVGWFVLYACARAHVFVSFFAYASVGESHSQSVLPGVCLHGKITIAHNGLRANLSCLKWPLALQEVGGIPLDRPHC